MEMEATSNSFVKLAGRVVKRVLNFIISKLLAILFASSNDEFSLQATPLFLSCFLLFSSKNNTELHHTAYL